MDTSKIVRLVAVIVAVIAGLVTIPQEALIIAVLGLIAGWFVEEERWTAVLVVVLTLNVAAGGADAIPGIGEYLTAIFTSLAALFNAGALTVIVKGLIARLKP